MEREDVKDELRELSEEGGSGGVLPAALLDIMEAGEKSAELAEKNMVTLERELNSVREKSEATSADHATQTKGVLDGMQGKHDAFAIKIYEKMDSMQDKHEDFAADVHKKLLWSIILSAVAIAAVLIVIVMIGLSQYG